MKKVLLITAYTPSKKGAAVKNTLYMLKDFSQHFAVDVVYFKDKGDDIFVPNEPNVNVIHVVNNSRIYRIKNALHYIWFHPLFTVRYNSAVNKIIQNHVDMGDYCAIVFDHSQTFMYARKLKFDGFKILLSHDIEAQRVKRSSNNLLYKVCLYTEKHFLSTPRAQLFALCQKDVDLIESLYNLKAKVSLIYVDENAAVAIPQRINKEYVMLGTWKRADNFEGAIWLLNGLPQYLTKPIKINIIGKNFPMNKIQYSHNINICNMGFVDNPYQIISESKAMLCPLFSGAGIKVKVIDSLACGTPVIGTDIAFEGFPEKYCSFMNRCQTLQEFAEKLETINTCMDERIAFKKEFVNDYKSTTIPTWLTKMYK